MCSFVVFWMLDCHDPKALSHYGKSDSRLTRSQMADQKPLTKMRFSVAIYYWNGCTTYTVFQMTHQTVLVTMHAHGNVCLLTGLAFSLHCSLPDSNVDKTQMEVLCKSLFQNNAYECQILWIKASIYKNSQWRFKGFIHIFHRKCSQSVLSVCKQAGRWHSAKEKSRNV